MKIKKVFWSFVYIIILSWGSCFSQEKKGLTDFPGYSIKQTIEIDSAHEVLELYSKSEKSVRIIYTEKSDYSNYKTLFFNRTKVEWYSSALCYSKKNDTIYLHLNMSPISILGNDIYYDAGLYSFERVDGIFSQDGMKRYMVPDSWMMNFVWDAFVKKDTNYSGFLDYVYFISDSCEKVFCITTTNGELFKEDAAIKYIKENDLYTSDAYTFLTSYLRRVENGVITSESAFTLNGHPELRNHICKNSLYNCIFVETDDGIWIIREHSLPVEKKDDLGNKYTVYEPDYLMPLLLEDSTGKIVSDQPDFVKNFKIFPTQSLKDYEDCCRNLNGYLLMKDLDGQSYWIYKNGSLIKRDSYMQVLSSLAPTVPEENKITEQEQFNFWMILTILLSLISILFLIVIIILKSKKYEQHLNKKDKKLIFIIQNKERTKISKDLHDSVVQSIRAIRTDVEMLKVPEEEKAKQQQIIKEITDSIILLRNICYTLSPAEISLAENTNEKDVELLSVIDTLAKQFSHNTKIPCVINMASNVKLPSFDLEVSKYVIRVVQEIFVNIQKHSFATKVDVFYTNEQLEKKSMFKIVIIDDGIGCEVEKITKNKHHFGIRNIIENMNSIGGKVEFYSKPNEGMNVVLKVPCGERNDS